MHAAATTFRLAATVVALLSADCSAPQAVDEPGRPFDEAPSGAAAASPERRLDPRALLRAATFDRLVAAAREADAAGGSDSTEGCLVRPPSGPRGFRLAADLALSVRPLPDAPEDLDALLEAAAGPVRPISPWGQLGDATSGPIVGSFTALPPTRGAEGLAIFVTDRGLTLRRTDGRAAPGPSPLSGVRELLVREARAEEVVVVTAEASVRLADLALVLAAVPEGLTVALGVVLPAETTLPPGVGPTEGAGGSGGLCAEGLPAEAPGARQGSLPARAIREALGPLGEAGRRCLASAASPGGTLELTFRIDSEGRVAEACATHDSAGSAALRACMLEALRGLSFPAPDPEGAVEVSLPLLLRVDHQRGLCEGDP